MSKPRRRLFWYVYLHALGMILVLVVTLIVLGKIISTVLPFSTYAEDFARSLGAEGPALFDDPADLEAQLKRELRRGGVAMTVRRMDGTLVASNVEPPLGAVPPASLPRLHLRSVVSPELSTAASGRRRFRLTLSMALPDRRDPLGYITIAVPLALPIAERLTMIFLGVLASLAIASIPLARIIARPVERLTATARALGQGDLSVRTGIRRNDEVGELASALDEMADRIQRLLKSEKELLANVSHELRTPLARIGVALDLAQEGNAEKLRGYLSEVRTDVSELQRLVEDVLTAAKLASGQGDGLPPLRRERCGARELLERSATRFRELHPERGIELAVEGELGSAVVDGSLVRRAFDNVLENAWKYSDQPITVRARRREEALEVEISDQGIGIDPADLPRLFTPFFRTDRSRARGTGGVGLGLALARRILEAHGGTLTVDSAPGRGSTFRFRVPANEEPDRNASGATASG